MTMFRLGPPVELREDVSRMYEKYANRIPRGTLMMLSPPGGDQKFYVYEWFTKDEEKVFYVGKGTGKRYKHIIADIDRPRGAAYKELQNAFGIDSRFLVKDLTALEAELYQLCTIIERTDAGEVLIQSANNPAMEKYWDSIREMMQICASRVFVPTIRVSDYRRRYFSVEVPIYDSFDATKLNVSFIASFNAKIPSVKVEMEKLKAAIESFGGKVFSTICKKTQAIIEFDNIDYEDFIKYKSSGYSVYHAFDVVNYLNGEKEKAFPDWNRGVLEGDRGSMGFIWQRKPPKSDTLNCAVKDLEDENARLKAEICNLQKEISDLKQAQSDTLNCAVKELEDENARLKAEICNLQKEISDLKQAQSDTLNCAVKELEDEDARLKAEICNLQKEISDLKQPLAELNQSPTSRKPFVNLQSIFDQGDALNYTFPVLEDDEPAREESAHPEVANTAFQSEGKPRRNDGLSLPDYIVIDVETTGLSPETHSIIQISAIHFSHYKECASYSTYINPGCSIPPRITALTGINYRTVANAPPFSQVAESFFKFLEKAPVITGYNISFDLGFISAATGIEMAKQYQYFDTLSLVKRELPGLPSYKLCDVCTHIGVSTEFHNALNDCRACGAVLNYICASHDSTIGLPICHCSQQQPNDLTPPKKAALKEYKAKVYQQNDPCPIELSQILSDGSLCGKRVVFTGCLSFGRSMATEMAQLGGALVKSSVSKKTDYLVVGEQDCTLVGEDGMSTKEERAYQLIEEEGAAIKIVSESEFLRLLTVGNKGDVYV